MAPTSATASKRPSHARCTAFLALALALVTVAGTTTLLSLLVQSGWPRATLRASTRAPSTGNATLSSLDAYFSVWARSFSNVSLLSTSPLGPVLPALLRGLHAHQNPPRCADASFLTLAYSSSLGFGHLLVVLHAALAANRILVVDGRTPFYWARGCKAAARDGRMECFFIPMSAVCPFEVVDALATAGTIQRLPDAKRVSDIRPADAGRPSVVHVAAHKLPAAQFKAFLHGFQNHADFAPQLRWLLSGAHMNAPDLLDAFAPRAAARRLWTAMAAWYVLRLNSATAHVVATALAHSLAAAPGVVDHRNMAGLALRASDKCSGGNAHGSAGEMTCVSLDNMMDAVLRLAFAQPTISHVVVSSEEKAAIDARKVAAAQERSKFRYVTLQVLRNGVDLTPETGSLGSKGLKKIGKTQAVLLHSMLTTLHLQALA